MLFTMALQLVGKEIAVTNRASIYEATIARLAERGGAAGIDVTTATLGVTFAKLLDEGRRYANPYEWARLVAGAVERLNALHIPVDASIVHDATQRSGLVTPIGHTQTLAPVHDSYADYLAGAAHASGLVPLPKQLRADDEQRALFAAEVGGLTTELAELVARDLPFLAVRIAEYDRRPLGDEALDEVTALLILLAPVDESRTVRLWHDRDRVIASLVHGAPQWVSPEEGRRLMRSTQTAICGPGDGPLTVAVRLWRLILTNRLKQPSELGAARIDSLQAARDALVRHATAEADALGELVRTIAPPGKEDFLATAVGPFGLTAMVTPADEGPDGRYWPVYYGHTAEVCVHTTDEAPEANSQYSGHSSIDYLIRQTPAESASTRMRSVINTLTTGRWL
jgi:hypothetical protein